MSNNVNDNESCRFVHQIKSAKSKETVSCVVKPVYPAGKSLLSQTSLNQLTNWTMSLEIVAIHPVSKHIDLLFFCFGPERPIKVNVPILVGSVFSECFCPTRATNPLSAGGQPLACDQWARPRFIWLTTASGKSFLPPKHTGRSNCSFPVWSNLEGNWSRFASTQRVNPCRNSSFVLDNANTKHVTCRKHAGEWSEGVWWESSEKNTCDQFRMLSCYPLSAKNKNSVFLEKKMLAFFVCVFVCA